MGRRGKPKDKSHVWWPFRVFKDSKNSGLVAGGRRIELHALPIERVSDAARQIASRHAVMLTSASEEIRSLPPSTFSAKVRTEPSSAPRALPVSSEMTQLCSGQVT